MVIKLLARCILAGFLVFGLSAASVTAQPARPNVVLLLADDLGYGDLACYGNPRIKSPHLDSLAADGIRFTSFYAAAPVCSPSRAGLLTGRTPSRLGIHDWIPAKSPVHLSPDELTIAALLKEVGYVTCHSGKWHLNGLFNSKRQPQPDDHGFDHWFATQNNAGMSHENPLNLVRNDKPAGELKGFSSDLLIQEAIDWLEKQDPGRPFFLNVWFHSTHEPVATSKKYTEMYSDVSADEAQYFGNVTQMDAAIGRLLQYLDDHKLSENTLVLFTSDNGPETLNRYKNANRSHGSAGPLRGMKLHLYEGGIRVPAIVRWPKAVKPGQTIDTPVHGCDLLPTVCELAGAPLPTKKVLDGVSIVALLTGQTLERGKPLYWQYSEALGEPKFAIREGDWKLLADRNYSSVELYNVAEDIAEARMRNDDQSQRVAEMTASLKELRDDVARDAADSGNPAE